MAPPKYNLTAPDEAMALLTALLKKSAQPGGMAKMRLDERRFVFAVLLASIVPADKRVKDVELEKLNAIVALKYQLRGEMEEHSQTLANSLALPEEAICALAGRMPELLSMDDCCVLIGQMWDIALSDNHLHVQEKAIIHKLSLAAGVPMRRVQEEEARAQGRH